MKINPPSPLDLLGQSSELEANELRNFLDVTYL